MLVHLQPIPTQKTCLFTNGNKANVSVDEGMILHSSVETKDFTKLTLPAHISIEFHFGLLLPLLALGCSQALLSCLNRSTTPLWQPILLSPRDSFWYLVAQIVLMLFMI